MPDPRAGSRALATADVIVVGGGLHGCSAALHCARAGLSVVVVEKDTVGRHASGVNAGGVRRLGRHPAEIPISLAAMEIWRDIAALVDDDCGFRPAAQIKVAESEAEMVELERRARLVRGLGFEHEEILDRRTLYEVLPALAPHCVGGLASMGDGFAEPYKTTFAFKRKAERLGVRFLEETRALAYARDGGWRVETTRGGISGGYLVNCAGAWANELAACLGEPVPLEPIAPMMIVTSRLAPFCEAVVGAAGRPLSFKQMPNGTVVIGGGRLGVPDTATGLTTLNVAELARSAQTAAELFPVTRTSVVVRCWAGIEARMPDDIPVIGPSVAHPDLFHAFGFSGHGFQLGPAVGRITAELIATGRSPFPIEAFRIDRFAVADAALR